MTLPKDEFIAEALKLAGLPSGKTFVAAAIKQKNKRDKGILAHAASLGKLAVVVEALKDLLEDTQHANHDCGAGEMCPVLAARQVLADLGEHAQTP